MPLDHEIYRSKLVVMPLRVTPRQNDLLKLLRDRDGMSVQEHVRRALDIYLARVNKKEPSDAEQETA